MIATQLSFFDPPSYPNPRGIAPANWQELYPYCEDFRTVNGKRVRSAYPLFYRDSDGVIWHNSFDAEKGYERWSE